MAEVPVILATTGIWADVVANIACDGLAEIGTIIPTGGDPHAFEPSLRDREQMESASLVVSNGFNLEESLVDTLEAVAASGTPVFEFAETMDVIPYEFEMATHVHHDEGHGEDDHSDHDDEGHDSDHEDHGDSHEDEGHEEADGDGDEDEGHDSDHENHGEGGHEDEGHEDEGHGGHGHGAEDPHVWFDPHRVAEALPDLAQVLTDDVGLDPAAVEACLASYRAELETVDAEIAAKVGQLPAESRKLITNHEALGYFAARYGFEIIGTVIPSPSSMAEASAVGLKRLAETIEHEDIKAIFAETQHSGDDIKSLAARVGDVDVVTLYTGSLGPPGSGADTYIGYLRTNTDLIVDSLN